MTRQREPTRRNVSSLTCGTKGVVQNRSWFGDSGESCFRLVGQFKRLSFHLRLEKGSTKGADWLTVLPSSHNSNWMHFEICLSLGRILSIARKKESSAISTSQSKYPSGANDLFWCCFWGNAFYDVKSVIVKYYKIKVFVWNITLAGELVEMMFKNILKEHSNHRQISIHLN